MTVETLAQALRLIESREPPIHERRTVAVVADAEWDARPFRRTRRPLRGLAPANPPAGR